MLEVKKGDTVISVLNGEDTDRVGIVIHVTENDIIVSPVEFCWASFEYDLDGNHREDTKFSIRKLK